MTGATGNKPESLAEKYVVRPDGTHLRIRDLNKFGMLWGTRDKEDVVLAVELGLISEMIAKTMFKMSSEELDDWRESHKEGGPYRLRRTRTQNFIRDRALDESMRTLESKRYTVPCGTLVNVGNIQLLFRPYGAHSIVAYKGKAVPLTPTETYALELLVLRSNTVVTVKIFFAYLRDNKSVARGTKMFDVLISNIRKKLGAHDSKLRGDGLIRTERGRGYCIDMVRVSRSVL